jgi:cysteinyl-tRNA synthetase
MKYLGETYDIHTGGVDLTFPHHENDIAISEALTGKPLANYWFHNELVQVEKSPPAPEERAVTLREALGRGYCGRDIRHWLLQMHYKRAIYFSWSKLDMARNTVSRLDRFIHKLRTCKKGPPANEIDQIIYDLTHRFNKAMDDDLNIAPALAALFEFLHHINRLIDADGLDPADRKKVEDVLARINSVLMVMDLSEVESSQQIEELIKERDDARQERNWERADAIRNELRGRGIEIIDTPDGTTWRRID